MEDARLKKQQHEAKELRQQTGSGGVFSMPVIPKGTLTKSPQGETQIQIEDVTLGHKIAQDYNPSATVESSAAPMMPLPAMDAGGSIIGGGMLVGHTGEEVDRAKVVAGGKTTLEKITDMFRSGGRTGSNINVGSTVINLNVDKISSDVDLEKALAKAGDEFDRKLIFRLRNSLDDTGFRGISYLRG